MLLKAEDQATFRALIEHSGGKVWASYQIEGRVDDKPVTQTDRRMFASTQEARVWLIGEAEERGFAGCEPEEQTTAA